MFDEVDMSQYPEKRKEILGQIPSDYQTVESPIIFQNSEESFDFVGLYDEFFNAREQDKTYQFLKIPPPEGSREHILWKKENEPEPEPEAEEAAEATEAVEETEINEESPEPTGDDYEFPGEAKPEEEPEEEAEE
ncbi:Oidioi.mRNA.OKI2018_I69.PAR.g12348.t1.cds [Oikopleura dioica]|uniref:Oidioi.mRNA.OKI2018_I69.PAR.g12348.t1.cds n=1 Tax=Oikopleura dioica TaxID=34765 RepID=A0ABN7S048_OIKDI|nr:Oidioi.mRNA.OKI2018_I69.PAR.g12348.t1.cds [Oikopleura dioica]